MGRGSAGRLRLTIQWNKLCSCDVAVQIVLSLCVLTRSAQYSDESQPVRADKQTVCCVNPLLERQSDAKEKNHIPAAGRLGLPPALHVWPNGSSSVIHELLLNSTGVQLVRSGPEKSARLVARRGHRDVPATRQQREQESVCASSKEHLTESSGCVSIYRP